MAFMVIPAGCSMIDEDQSDCVDTTKIDYDLTLITNLSIELQTQLDTDLDKDVADALREYLKNIFTDFAHDIDLSFYDTQGDSARLYHDQHIMDANQHSYTLYLPKRDYMHLASANLKENGIVSLAGDSRCHPAEFQQMKGDTITPHKTGLFTARYPLKVLEGIDQTFLVHLYMANCAAALVIDTQGYDASGMKVIGSGFASRFSICDSTFVFDSAAPVMKADDVMVKGGRYKCFCTVNFPSREPKATRSIIETTEPFIAQPGEESLWEFRVYVPVSGSASRSGESVTESVVRIREPLRAGQLKIVKVRLADNGTIESEDPTVGVSVTLDWQPGGTYTPEL